MITQRHTRPTTRPEEFTPTNPDNDKFANVHGSGLDKILKRKIKNNTTHEEYSKAK